ncbi:hypothetical protein TrST_g3477 [Triparma strigata]|uniref:Uncharacterized protein n=1 Tax=Triparma strigata TaxID=1606541 RepID=A0A9W7AWV2_9STRA|nr:hypothetical protein TrST_g3477 [Triparma strigata]
MGSGASIDQECYDEEAVKALAGAEIFEKAKEKFDELKDANGFVTKDQLQAYAADNAPHPRDTPSPSLPTNKSYDVELWEKCMAEHGQCLTREHPMFVMPVKTLLAMDELKIHEEVKDKLVEYKPGMGSVLFFSHTWLRWKAPDSKDVKITLIKDLLGRICNGTMPDINAHYVKEEYFGGQKISGAELTETLVDGYVWLDIFSIPQLDPEAQGRAIRSIVTYVNEASYFCVLAGPWKHEDDNSVRDIRGWYGRGWCRMELLANALSPAQKPIIVAQSSTVLELHAPSGPTEQSFLLYPVGHGNFTVDADKQALGPVIAGLIATRKAYALAKKDMLWFRTLHCLARHLLDGTSPELAPPAQSYEEWMQTMQFKEGDEPADGFTPLRYASSVAGSLTLTKALLESCGGKVDVEAPIKDAVTMFEAPPHCSILMQACKMHDNPELIEVLLGAGANPEVPDHGVGCNALAYACFTGRIKVIDLLMARAKEKREAGEGGDKKILWIPPEEYEGVKLQATTVTAFFPLVEYGQTEAFKYVAEKYPEEMRSAFAGPDTPCTLGIEMANWSVLMIGSVETLRACLDVGIGYGIDVVNRAPECVDPIWMGPINGLRGAFPNIPPEGRTCFISFLYYGFQGTSPLHQAAYLGNLGCCELLVTEYKANKDTQLHFLQMTPMMLAIVAGHTEIAKFLVNAGASIDLKDTNGKTAGDFASEAGLTDVEWLKTS